MADNLPDLLPLLDQVLEADEREIADLTKEVAIDLLLVMSAGQVPSRDVVKRAEVARERMEDNAAEIRGERGVNFLHPRGLWHYLTRGERLPGGPPLSKLSEQNNDGYSICREDGK